MAKTKKAPVATAADPFFDANGHALAINDVVLVSEEGASIYNGYSGTITGMHREGANAVATVAFKGDSTVAAGSQAFFLKWLTYVASQPVVQEEPALPWLDCNGNTLLEGDKAHVIPDISSMSGKLVTVLGNYDAQSRSIEVVDEDAYNRRILPHYLRLLPVLGDNLAEEPRLPTDITASSALGLRLVPLASIVVTTNTRKVFDETALAELAESVKAHGILQPIVLRPHSDAGQYELVAGGRRYRAAQLASLTEVPATVRHLTDREFLEVQLLENLQRVDVRPADEATAFAKLLASNFSAEEIAQRVGKPVKFVLQRAKLAALMPFWLEALEQGRLPIVAANEIARLPDEGQSKLENVAMQNYELKQAGAIFSAQWVKAGISQYVLRELNAAAFPKHDFTLCPEAGPCHTCPKRSGAVKQLFEEEELKHDYCLDAACFEQKKSAFIERRKVELRKETGKPAVQISTSYYSAPAGTLDQYKYKEAKEGAPDAVKALVMDGAEAGQTKWVVVRATADKSTADKEADAIRLRKERLTKTHRTLIAEKLTVDLPHALATQSPVYESVLTYLLLEECSSAKETLAYLRESWGWEPDEAALKNDYNDKDARGFRPWNRFVLEMVGPLSLGQKLEMYLALKVRHRMHYDYEDRQFTIAKLVAGHGYPELATEAEQAVELRYYTRKGKKQEVPA